VNMSRTGDQSTEEKGTVPRVLMEEHYHSCMTRSVLCGIGTGTIIFNLTYFGQKSLAKGLLKGLRPSIILGTSAIFSFVAGYSIVKDMTEACNKNFKKSGFILDGLDSTGW